MSAILYVTTEDAQQFQVSYEDNVSAARKAELETMWKHFNRYDPTTSQTYYLWYRNTDPKLELHVDYILPATAPAGRYRVEAFIPGRHATTRKAIYSVANNFHIVDGQLKNDDTVTVVDMYHLYDVWFSLGEYDLNPADNPTSGRVRQYDLSLEDPVPEVSFGPIRWVQLSTEPQPDLPRFDSPVGTAEERDGSIGTGQYMFGLYPVWDGSWYDVNPYLNWYTLGYHTGADLNLPGSSDADKNAPIYAIADGTVLYAGAAGSWGYIIVIEHPDALVTIPTTGEMKRQFVISRYGHVTSQILVAAGQQVQRGANIGFIGLPSGYVTGWHLHFDLCYTDRLRNRPAHWPDMSTIHQLEAQGVKPTNNAYIEAQLAVKREVLANYINPLKFLKDNHGS